MLGVACLHVKSEIHCAAIRHAPCRTLDTSAFKGFSPILLLPMHLSVFADSPVGAGDTPCICP